MHHDFHLETDNERLAGTVIESSSGAPRGYILSLHGAGNSTRQRAMYLAEHFSGLGFTTTTFDMSGHGESTGLLKESTLKRRHNQALAVATQATPVLPNIVMGSSMGGYIAITLLPDIPIEALILICPALYAAEAYDMPFDASFSGVLRRPGSYKDAHTLAFLETFKGSILFLIGEKDEVITSEIMETYLKSCPNARYVQHSVIAGAPHQIHLWATQSSANTATIFTEVDRFLDKAL